MTNFGVERLLEFLATDAPPPAPRETEEGGLIEPHEDRFSGFVFKIQANMNPRHRDRIAFARVVSGQFQRGMDVVIGRDGSKLRLAKPHSFMAQERSIVEEAWPGDIVGIYDSGQLRVGDTVSTGGRLRFARIPQFAPEHFGRFRLRDPLRRKALDTGLEQLAQEGVIQLFFHAGKGWQDPCCGAVGLLQFEVVKERLKNEYNVNAELERLPYNHARWVAGDPEGKAWLDARSDVAMMKDRHDQPVVLAESDWALRYALQNAPGLELHTIQPL